MLVPGPLDVTLVQLVMTPADIAGPGPWLVRLL